MTQYRRAVIVGVGLLGGSIGLALKRRGIAHHVTGIGRDLRRLRIAQQLGAIDETAVELHEAIVGADLVVVCVPVHRIAPTVSQILAASSSPDLLVTDVGSTKASICQQVDQGGGHDRFCGAHPLAGSEKQGVEHADAELFVDRLCIVTPTQRTHPEIVARVEAFWQQLGSRTQRMTPADHDQALAWTSHLPHVLASALASATPDRLLPLVASGWLDTTRVAAGGVELWQQILMDNRTAVLAALKEFHGDLGSWLSALESGDETTVASLLAAGKQKRDIVGS
ncbi:MAG: hypothetical protein KatS3mg111_1482 [Pirellulaceae bacterium]|nr:MAG: hypothetical protein KatS3mg111_1482 [Pirellulaceae bacterium]